MARVGVLRPSAKELVYLTGLLETAVETGPVPKECGTLLAKARRAQDPPKGADVRPLEDALAAATPDKHARLEGGGYARASRLAADIEATPEDVASVGRWLDAQSWIPAVTLLGVLENWHKWLPLAKKWGTPLTRRPGGNLGSVPEAGSGAAPGRRRSGGFR